MISLEALPRMYEELANHFARQGESRPRDQCLVLAADAALSAGVPEDAERLRKRLLLTNPHHLLRPYASMSEAMESSDVCDFVLDLRKQWPPEMLEKLLHRPAPAETLALSPLETVTKPVKPPKRAPRPEAPDEPVSGAGFWLAILLFGLGLVVAAGLLVAALGAPLLE